MNLYWTVSTKLLPSDLFLMWNTYTLYCLFDAGDDGGGF